jgi:hypothetical protein
LISPIKKDKKYFIKKTKKRSHAIKIVKTNTTKIKITIIKEKRSLIEQKINNLILTTIEIKVKTKNTN